MQLKVLSMMALLKSGDRMRLASGACHLWEGASFFVSSAVPGHLKQDPLQLWDQGLAYTYTDSI